MKNVIFASIIAVGSMAALIGPTRATSITIEGDGGMYSDGYSDRYSPDYGGMYVRHHHARDYSGEQYGDMRDGNWQYRHHRQHCRTEIIRHWRHHHRVIEQVRVCG
ncbi:hypothetical protein [Aminobacter sp. MET-1]|uniref:hypothetical protein n=1 Tax=Aminobacter sp. MET-1 TaxID=2951085 RepID=UPI00226AA912|nr:hypothetical protein [Aminobacter sp. MET-1]MCX8570727.1 hypothetical protein [Aminobacter sp. MET-1]